MLWLGQRPRAWDGTGHYGIAQVYDQTIFPDTFGWTHAYFGGMPYPNFYPPLFYWCVAFLHHTHLLSFAVAFKLVLGLSVLLLPAALWTLSWVVFDKDRTIAMATAFAALPLLIDHRFYNPVGINNASTFLIGLYTQPLGFVLLITWFVIYLRAHRRRWTFALSCVLLSLTILTNFFNAVTAALFAIATVANDIVNLYRQRNRPDESNAVRRALTAHISSPLVALCLSLFWLVPMVSEYDYFVTRPHTFSIEQLVPAVMWGWYTLALIGIVCWLRRPTQAMWPFLGTCFPLAAGVVFATTIAPRWFPLQSVRFLSTLNFLLAVPVGRALVAGFSFTTRRLENLFKGSHDRGERNSQRRSISLSDPVTVIFCLLLLIVAFVLIRPPTYTLAFLPKEGRAIIDPVLGFAQQHRDGRYLVEVPNFDYGAAALDGRALNSYLGAQGNEAMSVVFREASPHALFFNPLVTAFSAYPDNFGVSSVLADDLDFVEQPLSRHLNRARFVGVKYLVIVSPEIKSKLAKEEAIETKYDLGSWSVFQLRDAPLPQVRALLFRPALVVSGFSLKQRRRNQYDFTRLAEEQFADGSFDVLLARSPQSQIDRLDGVDQFGALLLDTYKCDDEDNAFARLREFAQRRSLILLSSDASLFVRMQSHISEFPFATIITRASEPPGEWLRSERPSFRYSATSIRREWQEIRQVLDQRKVPTEPLPVSGQINLKRIQIDLVNPQPQEAVPVLITTSFHPSWNRNDGQPVYATTPFFLLTFVKATTQLTYARHWYDWAALWLSAATLLLLCLLCAVVS